MSRAATGCVLATAMIRLAPPGTESPQRTDLVRVALIVAGVGIISAVIGIGLVRWTRRRRRHRIRRWVR